MVKINRLLYLAVIVLLSSHAYSQNKPTTATQVSNAYHVDGFPDIYSAGTLINYVRTKEAIAPITDESTFGNADYAKAKQTTQYIDGLGRPLQTVARQATPGDNPKDVVSPVTYDEFGRETNKYLPYVQSTGSNQNDGSFKLDPFTSQQSYYSNSSLNQNSGLTNEQVYYGKTEYEPSPLNRPSKTFAPGNSWAGSEGSTSEHAVKLDYLVNTKEDDAVRIWNITNDALTYANDDISINIPTSSTTDIYNTGELYKNVTTDENGKQVIEYKDKEGQIVLKKVQLSDNPSSSHQGWLCTYYVYDDLNQLRFVIPPKAVEWLSANGWSFSSANGESQVVPELCFRYEYDARKRMIAKKVPGAGWVYMIYDVRDRLVYTQDANMRTNNKWMVNLYDEINRLKMTGIMTYTGTRNQLDEDYVGNHFSTDPGTIGATSPLETIPVDKLISFPITGTLVIKASHSITFNPGTVLDGRIVAQLENGSIGNTTEDVEVLNNPLPPNSNFIALTINYYDDYSFTNKSYSAADNSKLDAGVSPYQNTYPEDLPSSKSDATKGLLTGSKVRVLNPADLSQGAMLESVNFYDDKGRIIQVQSQNYKLGTDVLTNKYDFTGKVICSYLSHKNPSSATPFTRVKTNMYYDHSGSLVSITKKINDEDETTRLIERNEYSPLGELKIKKLGQQKDVETGMVTDEPVETLNYSYNIRGWLKSINHEYNKLSGSDDNWFGMDLNYDWGFDHNELNGNISGETWRSKGDGEHRAYGFGYDNVNRLQNADFTQNNNDWNNDAGINFSVSNLSYDANGNIQAMNQSGLKINSSSPIDELTYGYQPNSNKLKLVTDAVNDNDSKLGDFKYDGTTKTTEDYAYDDNGNMIADKNKNISSITYNHLNLPQEITVTGKGTIAYTYDAAGNKFEKTTVDNTTSGKTITTTTTYLGGFVYESKTTTNPSTDDPADYTQLLQFFGHEEGRVRYKAAVGNIPASFAYDYFIKDHLGNVRMVLTDEQQQDKYPLASLEQSKIATEKSYYDIQDAQVVSKLEATGITDYVNDNGIGNNPPDQSFSTTNSAKLYKLNSTTVKTGLGTTIKVMAGDKIDVFVKSYYFKNTSGTSGNSTIPVIDLLAAFLSAPTNATTAIHGATAAAINMPANMAGINSMISQQSTQNNSAPTKPRAFINVIFFDEQFKSYDYRVSMVGNNSEVKDHYSELQNIAANKNGYVYIYCSNESPVNVFFDNLQVVHTKGALLEETHYYPFGLQMAGISSKAAGIAPNRDKTFQGQKFDDDLGLDYVEFKYRNHDPQIGRFIEIDPLSDKYVYNSTYAFSENKVTNDVELEGLESISAFLSTLLHNAGYSENTDSKTFVKNIASEFTKPETYQNAALGMEPVLGATIVGISTGGLGEGAYLNTTLNTGIPTEVTTAEMSSAVSLEARAKEIHSTLSIRTQNATTTAVASATTAEGESTTLVGFSEKNLRSPQLASLKPGEVAVSGEGHAETTILNHAAANGMQVNAVAASRPICAGCATAINNAGAVPASPLKIYPVKAAADATYVKPPVFMRPKQ